VGSSFITRGVSVIINIQNCNAATVAAAKAMYDRARAQLSWPTWESLPEEEQSAWCASVSEAKKMSMVGCHDVELSRCQFEKSDAQLVLPGTQPRWSGCRHSECALTQKCEKLESCPGAGR
jgi:hypothetical protein